MVSRRQGLLKMVFVLEFITRIPCIYAVAPLPWVCSLTRGGEAVELTRSEARERRTTQAPKDSNWTKRLLPGVKLLENDSTRLVTRLQIYIVYTRKIKI